MGALRETRVLNGSLDTDSVIDEIKQNDYPYALNVYTGAIDSANRGIVKPIKGNTLIDIQLPQGYNKTIGAFKDNSGRYLFYFVYQSAGEHSILRYDSFDRSIAYVILGSSILNFSLDYRIRKANYANGQLFWTDAYNPPCAIDVQKAIDYTAGISGGYIDLARQTLDFIKYPPLYEPTCSYGTSASYPKNNVLGNLFQFCYKYVYDNNQESCWSPISVQPLPSNSEAANGTFINEIGQNNKIDIICPVDYPNLIRKVKIAVRSGNVVDDVQTGKGGFYLIETVDLTNDTAFLDSNGNVKLKFFNDKTGLAVDPTDFDLFDYVPLLADMQELVLGENIAFGGLTEGFDNPVPDVKLYSHKDYKNMDNSVTVLQPYEWNTNPTRSFNIGTNSIGYLGFISGRHQWTIYYFKWFYIPDIEVGNTMFLNFTHEDGNSYFASHTKIQGETVAQITSNLFLQFQLQGIPASPISGVPGGTIASGIDYIAVFYKYDIHTENFIFSDPENTTYNVFPVTTLSYSNNTLQAYPDWKATEPVEFVLEYFDHAGRSGGAISSKEMQVNVPDFNRNDGWNYFLNHIHLIRWEIHHLPPQWAYSFRWAVSKRPSVDKHMQFICIDMQEDTGRPNNPILIDINSQIRAYNEDINKSILAEWVWQKGDRIRLRGVYRAGYWIAFNTIIDKEIIDIDFLDTQDIIDNARSLAQTAYDAQSNSSADSKAKNAAYASNQDKTFGKFVVENFSMLALGIETDDVILVEAYRPKKVIDTKLYYEFDRTYPILNPGTANAVHGGMDGSIQLNENKILLPNQLGSNITVITFTDQTLTGVPAKGYFERGNVFLKNRTYFRLVIGQIFFPVEEENFSDFYISNSGDYGRVTTIVENMKRDYFPTKLRHGGKLLEDSNINNIARLKFDGQKVLPYKYGTINGMEEAGYSLKVLAENKVTTIDINRNELVAADGSGTLISIEKLLGSERPSNTDFGCSDFTSVIKDNRHIFFCDRKNARIIMDAANGQIAISDNRMTTGIKRLISQLNKFEKSEVLAGFQNSLDMLYFSFLGYQTSSMTNSGSVLFRVITGVTYTIGDTVYLRSSNLETGIGTIVSIINGYVYINTDLFVDSKLTYEMRMLLGCVTYCTKETEQRWKSYTSHNPDCFGSVGSDLVSFQDGKLYVEFDNETRCNLYGVQYKPEIEAVFNQAPVAEKIFKAMSYIGGNGGWYVPTIEVASSGMESRLLLSKFIKKNNIYYADFMQDLNTPGLTTQQAIINGRTLRGRSIAITMTNDNTDDRELYEVSVSSFTDEMTP